MKSSRDEPRPVGVVPGEAMGKRIRQVFRYASASSPGKTYETLLFEDGSTSCNCPSWTRRKCRQCKHTLDVEAKVGVCAPPPPLTKEREQALGPRPKPKVTATSVPALNPQRRFDLDI